MVRKSLGDNRAFPEPEVSDTLYTCAQAQAEQREILFSYRGIKDEEPRPRRAVVSRIFSSNDIWYVRAIDLNLNQERTFRIDRMSCITLGNTTEYHTTQGQDHSNTHMIRITFTDEECLTVLEWNELRVLHRSEDSITCEIPYYGPQSLWLIRRIAACGGSVRVEDEDLIAAVRDYVSQRL
jgi:proteasome accessory factor C